MLADVDMMEEYTIGSLDIIGMFPNVPVKKTLEVVREELQKDETLKLRTDWEIDDIMKLLEIFIETLDGKYISREMVYQLVNRFQSHWPGFICIGLKEHMYLMRLKNSVTTLYFGRDRWMIYFLYGKAARRNWSCLCGS